MSPSPGPPLEVLLASLADERFERRCQALEQLGQREKAEPSLLPHLLRSLEDPAWQVRSAAARALAALKSRETSVSQALLSRALDDPHLWVRHAALASLEAAAFPSEELRGPLLEALSGAHPALHRLRALQALSRLGIFSEPTIRALLEAVEDADWEVRAGAVRVLGESGQDVPHVARAVTAALGDADPVVREAACEALSRRSALREEELEALERVASDVEPQVRIACARALGQSSTRHRGQALRALVRDADERVREAAVVALCRAGHDGLPLSLWTEFLEDPSVTVRQAAESFLSDTGQAGVDLEPLLAGTLAHRSRLASTDGRDPSTLEPLTGPLLELSEPVARDVAAHLAATDEPRALPPLLEGLRHREVRVRHRAARALGFFVLDSSTAARGVPLLGQALLDPSERVRRAATESLGRVGLPALPTYPGLIRRAFEQTEHIPPRARKAIHGWRAALPGDWVLPGDAKESAEALFSRWVEDPTRLSRPHQEELLRLCLHRERWHLQLCRLPVPMNPAPSTVKEAAARAATAAVAHGASRRRQARPAHALRDREREYAWLLGRLHALALAGLAEHPTP